MGANTGITLSGKRPNDSFGGFALNTKWHIAVSYRDMGNGDTMVHWTKRNAATGRIVRNRWSIVKGWTIAELRTYTLNIGHSFYESDIDANAKYDEVRIWNGALSDATLAETMPFVRAVLDRRPNVYSFVDGK